MTADPVFPVNIFVGVPLPGQKRMLLGDDLAVEERRQSRELLRESLDLEVAAQIRVIKVNVLQQRRSVWVQNLLRLFLDGSLLSHRS